MCNFYPLSNTQHVPILQRAPTPYFWSVQNISKRHIKSPPPQIYESTKPTEMLLCVSCFSEHAGARWWSFTHVRQCEAVKLDARAPARSRLDDCGEAGLEIRISARPSYCSHPILSDQAKAYPTMCVFCFSALEPNKHTIPFFVIISNFWAGAYCSVF